MESNSNPNSSDFLYKEYSLQQLDNWVHDVLNCEDLSPQEIYDTIVNCVESNCEYYKKSSNKSTDLLSLLKGNRSVDFDLKELNKKSSYYFDYNQNMPNKNITTF